MENLKLLDELFSEGELLSKTIYYVPSPEGVWRTFSVYSTNDLDRYQLWQSSVQRFIKAFYPSELDDFKGFIKEISPDNHRKILGILSAIKLLPVEPSLMEKDNSRTKITINNTQNNSNSIVFNLFVDAIKDEIRGKDLKQLSDILKVYEKNPESSQKKLIEKIKSFGGDVLTNIVANIITNPSIYKGLII